MRASPSSCQILLGPVITTAPFHLYCPSSVILARSNRYILLTYLLCLLDTLRCLTKRPDQRCPPTVVVMICSGTYWQLVNCTMNFCMNTTLFVMVTQKVVMNMYEEGRALAYSPNRETIRLQLHYEILSHLSLFPFVTPLSLTLTSTTFLLIFTSMRARVRCRKMRS